MHFIELALYHTKSFSRIHNSYDIISVWLRPITIKCENKLDLEKRSYNKINKNVSQNLN